MEARRLAHVLNRSLLLVIVPVLLAAAPAAAPTPSPSPGDDDVKAKASVELKLLPSGASEKLGGYNPQQVKLTQKKPASVKKAPETALPSYGELRFGGKAYALALDEPRTGEAKLYVDSNGNGDLTDDPETTWTKVAYQAQDGTELNRHTGTFQLPLKVGEKEEPVTLTAYRFDRKDPQRQQLADSLFYYSDYAFEGAVTLAGATYHAMLTDMAATGTFGGPAKGSAGGGSRLLIDVNGDGKFTPRGEMFDASQPFNIKGTTWKIQPAASGPAPIQIARSDQKVGEVALPPNHAVGQKITPFTAKRMDGKTVNFPADYKGKLVMLDFWATWCPPCMGEVPGLVKTYNEYHPKGVEILGISLDQANAAGKVKSVTAENGMTWPQVYDGKFWKAAVADTYGINSIPSAFLVDGDTGVILAAGSALRGENLPETLKKAIETRSTSAAPAAQTAKATKDTASAPDSEKTAREPKPAPEAKPPF